MQSVARTNFVVNRVDRSTYSQRTFTLTPSATVTSAHVLLSITPGNNATNQLATTAVKLVFSEALDPFTIMNDARWCWMDDDLKTVRLLPHAELAASTAYTVNIGSGNADLCGNKFTPVTRDRVVWRESRRAFTDRVPDATERRGKATPSGGAR